MVVVIPYENQLREIKTCIDAIREVLDKIDGCLIDIADDSAQDIRT